MPPNPSLNSDVPRAWLRLRSGPPVTLVRWASQMSRTADSIILLLSIAAISGCLGAWFPHPTRGLQLLLTFGPGLLFVAVIFWWLERDSVAYGFRRSALLNVGIVALAIVFLPVYLYRSRPQGKRLDAIVGVFCVLVLYLLVQFVAAFIVGVILEWPEEA